MVVAETRFWEYSMLACVQSFTVLQTKRTSESISNYKTTLVQHCAWVRLGFIWMSKEKKNITELYNGLNWKGS